jgi:acetyl esterase/lipase
MKCCQCLVSDDVAGPDVHSVEDFQVSVSHPQGEITVRMYTPEGTGPFPVHFNMHGGEFVLSDRSKTVIY